MNSMEGGGVSLLSEANWPITSLLTYFLTYSMEQSPSWEDNRLAASQEIPLIYETRSFIAAFTSARHLSLSWASPVQSITPHPTAWRYILILFSTYVWVFQMVFSLWFSHQNPVRSSPLPHTCRMPRPSHSSLFYHPNNIGWGDLIIKLIVM
jgi:hypothetical protein